MRGIIWNEGLEDRLKALYETGISSSQIAAEMNCGISRNAVIGKIHRMRLIRDNGHEARRPRAPETYYTPRIKLAKPVIVLSPITGLRCVEIEPRNISLMDLGPDDCRWPYGDGPITFCGCPMLKGSSYCGPHFHLSVGPGTYSERSATRINEAQLGAVA